MCCFRMRIWCGFETRFLISNRLLKRTRKRPNEQVVDHSATYHPALSHPNPTLSTAISTVVTDSDNFNLSYQHQRTISTLIHLNIFCQYQGPTSRPFLPSTPRAHPPYQLIPHLTPNQSTINQLTPLGSYFEAFFADDGQRSLRYAPFYANSGFYYLLANERSVYFTWSIMISFDLIQVSGSHQNVLPSN